MPGKNQEKKHNRAENSTYCQYYLGTMATDGGRQVLGLQPSTILIQYNITLPIIKNLCSKETKEGIE